MAQGENSALVDGYGVDDDGLDWLVATTGADSADLVHHVAAGLVCDLTEDRVLSLQMRRRARRDEKLRAVSALTAADAGVGHGQDVGLAEVLVRADLVVERVAVATHAAALRAPTLNHEARDDTVEGQAVVVRGRTGSASVVLVVQGSVGETDEVRNRLGGVIGKHRDVDIAQGRVKDDVHGLILACTWGP